MVIDDAKQVAFKPGESLAPNTSTVFRQLHIEHILLKNHSVYTGNTVVWGNSEPNSRHFFNEPYGNGWHLDRIFFEKQLREIAEERGAIWKEGWRFTDANYQEEKLFLFFIDNQGDSVELEAAYGVDCTGRASGLARKLGVKKQTLDSLTAYYFILNQSPKSLTGISFIEAVEDGWWYAAPLNNNCAVVNFMTDSDLHDVKPATLQAWLFEKMQKTENLSEVLQITSVSQITESKIKTASTSFLEQPLGFKWIAVGDALCSYDPLTSFGISVAISSSYPAAQAVKKALEDDSEALSKYVKIQQQTFNTSIGMLRQQYRLEKRWKESTFWKRRY